jgi:hypothetical protein
MLRFAFDAVRVSLDKHSVGNKWVGWQLFNVGVWQPWSN